MTGGERTVTLEVTQDCIDQAALTPQNYAVARAARNAGIKIPVVAAVPHEMLQWIYAFDQNEVVAPATFTATFRRNRQSGVRPSEFERA